MLVSIIFIALGTMVRAQDPTCGDEKKVWTNVSALYQAQCVNLAGSIFLGDKFYCIPDSLVGLKALVSVRGDFVINQCIRITNLTGLNSLKSVGGLFAIQVAAVLTSVDGLDNLESVGSLLITDNPKLENLDGFGNLASISGSGSVSITSCDSLKSLAGLRKITNIPGGLRILLNPSLGDLSGLGALQSVSTKLELYSNKQLSDLNALGNLRELNGPLVINGNRITVSAFGELQGLTVGTSLIAEDEWPCPQIKKTGLPAPNPSNPIVQCKEP